MLAGNGQEDERFMVSNALLDEIPRQAEVGCLIVKLPIGVEKAAYNVNVGYGCNTCA